MRKIIVLLGLLASSGEAQADTIIKWGYMQTAMDQSVSVNPRQWSAYHFEAEASGSIQVQASADNGNTEGTVFVCDKPSFYAFKDGRASDCYGIQNKRGSLVFSYEANRPGSYFIVADNRQTLFSKKTYSLKVSTPALFSKTQVAGLQSAFEDIEGLIKKTFIAPDFDFIMRPCGHKNAFSNLQTGDITICTEYLLDSAHLRSEGQITGILLHELGHTLLNYWGNPAYRNEETADAFATYLLMVSGAWSMIEEFASSFETGNPWAEAEHIIKRGDSHQISVQRARAIRQNVSRADEFTSRWNKTVYPYLTDTGLHMIIDRPGRYGDPRMAQMVLNSR